MASEDVPFQCQKCGIESSPKRRILVCTRCFSVGYCSKSCQKADWKGHKPQCRPTTKPTVATVVDDSPSLPAQEDDTVVRLQVKRGEIDSEGNDIWDDAGPINLLEDNMANATIHHSNKKMGDSSNRSTATLPVPKNASTKPPNLVKELPITTQRILGPESSYKYRHSSDGVDENLLIFFHGAGDSNLPYDALGKRMELPQTATLSLSASMSLNLRSKKDSQNELSRFVELPFGLGSTWFEEMDYSSGETLPKDHPRRLKSLKHAVRLLDSLLGSLTGVDSGDGDDATWIPERIFLFGFSAGACLVHGLCRMWWNAGRMALGGVICIAGGIQTKQELPGMKPKGVTQQNQATDVLIITGSKDSTYPKEAAQLSKQFYHPSKVQIHVQRGKGHSMIESKDEMQVIMEFLSKRLVRRMLSMEGQCR